MDQTKVDRPQELETHNNWILLAFSDDRQRIS